MKVDVYSIKGEKTGEIELDDKVFNYPWNGDLVHQVIHSQMSNRRANTAHTKDRGEVSGGGKKPWRQKGTGRARHGSIRSPLWRHGGVTHGPRNERNYKKVIPKVMRNRALYSLLSAKLRDGKILFLNEVKLQEPKTKLAYEVMQSLTKVEGFKTINWKKHNNAVIYTAERDNYTHLAFRNLPNVKLKDMNQMNPLDIANTRYIIIANPKEVNSYLSSKD